MNLQYILPQISIQVDPKVDIGFWESRLGKTIIISLLAIFCALITTYLRDLLIERKKRKIEINQIVISSIKELLNDVEKKINNPRNSPKYTLSDNQFFLKELQKIDNIDKIEQSLTKSYLQRQIEDQNNELIKLRKSLRKLLNEKLK